MRFAVKAWFSTSRLHSTFCSRFRTVCRCLGIPDTPSLFALLVEFVLMSLYHPSTFMYKLLRQCEEEGVNRAGKGEKVVLANDVIESQLNTNEGNE